MFAAIKSRDAACADNLAREETAHAAIEGIQSLQLLRGAERPS
jgi:hypothetical protein